MPGQPILEYMSSGNNTPLCSFPLSFRTSARILPLTNFKLKVLVLVSPFYCAVLAGQDWISATVSEKRAMCFLMYHILRRLVILRKILCALRAPRVIYRITPMNTMGRSVFHI